DAVEEAPRIHVQTARIAEPAVQQLVVHGVERIADGERDIVQFGSCAGRGAAQYAGDQAFGHAGASARMEAFIMPWPGRVPPMRVSRRFQAAVRRLRFGTRASFKEEWNETQGLVTAIRFRSCLCGTQGAGRGDDAG